ncbi:facilitated trehalose transporter Tret1-like [Thrips palmi]|uniref:Facilitated trehalose transporter Tret1-like n=1 Tax=Thrips palmi TaxID=161013 RepID=A0A6P8ZHZ4_THRPL|nr:facilitated trehalose transporter Tret1-like [Thrips palmi]XP_034232710.1 facilitated trehalose transporter Tret1-like [Thrips palmi]
MAPPGKKLPQYTAAVIASMSVMAAGCCIAWPSPALKILGSADAPFKLQDGEGSWIVSLKNLGNILAPLPTGWLMGRIGRRATLLGSAVPFIASWGLLLLFKTAPLLYLARVLGGLGVGIAFTVAPIYLGEIADTEVRGALGTLLQAMLYCGILLEYCVGPYVSYYSLALVSGAVPAIFAVLFFFMPESPHWLLQRGRREDARRSLRWLRGTDEQSVAAELGEMTRAMELQAGDTKGGASMKDVICSRGPRKALIIVVTLQVLKEMSGNSAVVAYAATTLHGTGSPYSDEYVIAIGVVMFLATMACTQLVDRAGRRPLLLASCGLSALSLSTAGLYFFLKWVDPKMDAPTWLPVGGLLAYGVAYPLGLAPIPAALLGELFPAHLKGLAACSAAISLSIASLVVTKLYHVVGTAVGMHVVYWTFAASCVGGAAFVATFVPETKRKTFQQIQDELNGLPREKGAYEADEPLKIMA